MVPFKELWIKLIAAWKTTSPQGWGLQQDAPPAFPSSVAGFFFVSSF
jgi:hypothetical protein